MKHKIAWIIFGILLIAMCWQSGCIQHELTYDYYLKDPNSLHVESLHYKQNVFAAKTDKVMTEAVFADVIKVRMDRSTQTPDPNTVRELFKGTGTVIKEVAPVLIRDPLYLKGFEDWRNDRGGV